MPEPTFGLFLNLGAQLAPDHAGVFDFALRQAELAEQLGYHDVWVTEHHFIDFGINSSALTLAAFLLGATRRLRVGTAVTLAPLYHPLQLAEQAAILDQASGGRFDFGIGRGGYLADFEAFGVDLARWDEEIDHTLETFTRAWAGPRPATPRPRTGSRPPLFAASTTPATLAKAAAVGAPLLHYFAAPAPARVKTEAAYAEHLPGPPPIHVHTLIALVADDEAKARERLREALTVSFRAGDQPSVPGASGRHGGLSREELAKGVAENALIGDPRKLADDLAAFIGATGARRLAFYMEAVGDQAATLSSVERFAGEVRPLIAAMEHLSI